MLLSLRKITYRQKSNGNWSLLSCSKGYVALGVGEKAGGGMSLGWTYSSSGSDAGKRKKLFQLPAPRRRRQRERESACKWEGDSKRASTLCVCVRHVQWLSWLATLCVFVCASLPGTLLPPAPYTIPRVHVAEPEDTDKDIDEVRNSSY